MVSVLIRCKSFIVNFVPSAKFTIAWRSEKVLIKEGQFLPWLDLFVSEWEPTYFSYQDLDLAKNKLFHRCLTLKSSIGNGLGISGDV